ncbi:glycosyltransferase [Jatrophihabitans sp.]|uniref:glycosyltransferase n=1 Tax=Jatrophihabitans sp. TaxID=1932789 RepID=UPI002BD3E79E|nr:glycosyltransferase family 2 protein [Jatrophihabitans sp.]
MTLSYLLPIKSEAGRDIGELARYLDQVSRAAQVIVVDGSPPAAFAAHRAVLGPAVTHVRPAADVRYRNGKVNGVVTGFRLCDSDKVVIADDDVRYEPAQLHRLELALDTADLVRPQNYFRPLPWHARWDTARSLLNRAVAGADFPGTLAVRLTPELRAAGYDGDVLFENLELIRTVHAAGGRERLMLDLYVRRLPPSTRHFLRQRVRQAYDSFAQPGRMIAELALLPAFLVLGRHPARLALALAAAVGLAEAGRRRGHGRTVFASGSVWFTPAWLAERSVCSWLAVATRLLFGGVRYSGDRISRAAHSPAELRRRWRPVGRRT